MSDFIGSFVFKPKVTALAPLLFQQSCWTQNHASIHRFTHVVNRQAGDGYRRQCFHFHTCASCDANGRFNSDAALINFDHGQIHAINPEGVAKRDQIGRPLGRHDAGKSGDFEDITLGDSTTEDQLQRFRLHLDKIFGSGQAKRHFLLADIDHPGMPLFIEM